MREPIKKITTSSGQVRYRLVVDIGTDPATGKRRQKTTTHGTLREARAELSRVRHQRNDGSYVPPDKITVSEYLDEWLARVIASGRRNGQPLTPATASSMRRATRIPRELIGDRKLQSVTAADIAAVKEYMRTAGRKHGKSSPGLGPAAIGQTLMILRGAFRDAVAERRMSHNPAETIKAPADTDRPEQATWSGAEVCRFLAAAAPERLGAVLRLTCLAMRPSEVLGLRWDSVDTDAGTLTIERVRTTVDGKPDERDKTKTRSGKRTLPLDPDTVAALRELHRVQSAERLAAGPAYELGSHGGYVACDELGRPLMTADLRREFHRVAAAAGLPEIRLYNARHSCLSYLANEGRVPIAVVAAWAGHANPAITLARYVKTKPEDLVKVTAALSGLFRAS